MATQQKKTKSKKTVKPDKYDRAISYYEKNSNLISHGWQFPFEESHGCLFRPATRIKGRANFENCKYSNALWPYREDGKVVGCLTLIRNPEKTIESLNSGKQSRLVACTDELTKAIRRDKRIPKEGNDISVNDLPVFAEWQRKIDAHFKSKKRK